MPEQKVTDGPWEITPDGYRIWSETAHTIILWSAHNKASRTPQAKEVIRLAMQAPALLRELQHLVELFEDSAGTLHFIHAEALDGARKAIAEATDEIS